MHSVQNRKATNKIFNTNSWLQPNTRQSNIIIKTNKQLNHKMENVTERLFPNTNYVTATKQYQGTIQSIQQIIKQEPKLTEQEGRNTRDI
jgi:hypothetical protein